MSDERRIDRVGGQGTDPSCQPYRTGMDPYHRTGPGASRACANWKRQHDYSPCLYEAIPFRRKRSLKAFFYCGAHELDEVAGINRDGGQVPHVLEKLSLERASTTRRTSG